MSRCTSRLSIPTTSCRVSRPHRKRRSSGRGDRHAGLRYVYTGNVHDGSGGATHCPGCGRPVIERDWYEILTYALDDTGHCEHCGAAIAGRFGHFGTPFGSRRIRVSLHAR